MAKDPDPQDFDDPNKLRILIKNAKRLGREDLAWACQVRIAELAGREFESALDQEFWTAVTVAEEIKTQEYGRTTQLSRTRQKYNRDGAKKCIEDLAIRDGVTDGFRILADNDRIDLTFEAVLLRHADVFDPASIEIAKSKLLANGASESDVARWLHHGD